MNKILSFFIAINFVCLAEAHHSTANFDSAKDVPISGVATYFSFTNPHSFIDMDVTNDKGEVVRYKVFVTSKVVLARYGWNAKSVLPGDKISVTGNPDKTDNTFLYLRKIDFANGKTWLRNSIDN